MSQQYNLYDFINYKDFSLFTFHSNIEYFMFELTIFCCCWGGEKLNGMVLAK